MPFLSLDQERAKKAWEFVGENQSVQKNKEYRSLVRAFPSMVQSMGIGQSVAFLMAKGDGHHSTLLTHLTEWLFSYGVPWNQPAEGRPDDKHRLFRRLIGETPQLWWVAEQEAIEFCIWLKRFAEAFDAT